MDPVGNLVRVEQRWLISFTMFGASGGTGGGDRESLLANLVPGAGGRAAD